MVASGPRGEATRIACAPTRRGWRWSWALTGWWDWCTAHGRRTCARRPSAAPPGCRSRRPPSRTASARTRSATTWPRWWQSQRGELVPGPRGGRRGPSLGGTTDAPAGCAARDRPHRHAAGRGASGSRRAGALAGIGSHPLSWAHASRRDPDLPCRCDGASQHRQPWCPRSGGPAPSSRGRTEARAACRRRGFGPCVVIPGPWNALAPFNRAGGLLPARRLGPR